eukprot:2727761-Rhodomonas_salina.2
MARAAMACDDGAAEPRAGAPGGAGSRGLSIWTWRGRSRTWASSTPTSATTTKLPSSRWKPFASEVPDSRCALRCAVPTERALRGRC